MGTVMKGAEVAKEMKETLIREANELKEKGIDPAWLSYALEPEALICLMKEARKKEWSLRALRAKL